MDDIVVPRSGEDCGCSSFAGLLPPKCPDDWIGWSSLLQHLSRRAAGPTLRAARLPGVGFIAAVTCLNDLLAVQVSSPSFLGLSRNCKLTKLVLTRYKERRKVAGIPQGNGAGCGRGEHAVQGEPQGKENAGF